MISHSGILQSNADLLFGGVTIVCGIFGSLAGGYVLDLMTSTLSNAFKVDSLAIDPFLCRSEFFFNY